MDNPHLTRKPLIGMGWNFNHKRTILPDWWQNLGKMGALVLAPEGFKVWKMPKFKMAATAASADRFGSDLGGSHFLATKCFWHQIEGWGCMTAKVDPSNSAVCGWNQLISLGPLSFMQKMNLAPNVFRSLVSCCLQKSCFLQAKADQSTTIFWCQTDFLLKNKGP